MSPLPVLMILPWWGIVHFEVHYNADRIIEINVSTDPSQTVDISPDVASKTEGQLIPAEFTYRCPLLPPHNRSVKHEQNLFAISANHLAYRHLTRRRSQRLMTLQTASKHSLCCGKELVPDRHRVSEAGVERCVGAWRVQCDVEGVHHSLREAHGQIPQVPVPASAPGGESAQVAMQDQFFPQPACCDKCEAFG